MSEHHELTISDMIPARSSSPINADYRPGYYDRPDFYDGANPENLATKLAEFVPGDLVRQLRERMTEEFTPPTVKRRSRRLTHRSWGERVTDAVEYDRFSSGVTRDQHFWERRETVERPHRGIVTISTAHNISAAQKASDIAPRGAIALALVDLLEDLGYRVNLSLEFHVGEWVPGELTAKVCIKAQDERLAQNAFGLLCSGGMWRVAWFQWLLSLPYKAPFGLGHNIPFDSSTSDVFIPDIRTDSQAMDFVRKIMERYQS